MPTILDHVPSAARRAGRRRVLRRHVLRGVLAAAAGAAALAAGGCSLDVTNPNAANEESVLSTAAGLRAVTVGLQGRLGNALEEGVWVPALVSGELGNTSLSQSTQREFQEFPAAGTNTAIEDSNNELLDHWAKYYAVVRSADDILGNVDRVTLAPGTSSGMTAIARTYKAIALGQLVESFERIPIETTQDDPPFAERAAVLARVLELLATARQGLETTPPSAEFTTTLLSPGVDLPNLIRAMQARYSLAAGQYEQALAFANEVPGTAASEIRFSATDQNPLQGVIHELGYFAALASFREGAEAGDTRVDRFTTPTPVTAFGGASLVQVNIHRLDPDPIPLFTQDELTLVRAEAHARANRLPEARTEVNRVRTAAGLPALDEAALPTQQAVLDEIYRQRSYSLFLMGLHWADQRRFGRIDEAKVAWLPYPLGERATNPNTPPNP